MRILLTLVVAVSALAACSSSKDDSSTPAPATVKIDSTGIVVDTAPGD